MADGIITIVMDDYTRIDGLTKLRGSRMGDFGDAHIYVALGTANLEVVNSSAIAEVGGRRSGYRRSVDEAELEVLREVATEGFGSHFLADVCAIDGVACPTETIIIPAE